MSTTKSQTLPPETEQSIAKNNKKLRGLKSVFKNFFSGTSRQPDNQVETPLENVFTEPNPVIYLENPIRERPSLDELEDYNDDTNSGVEDTVTEDMPWINPETTKNLIDIAVDILKQTIDNETQTMTSLVGIAVDILTKTIEARTNEIPRTDKGYGFKGITLPTLEYTLPKASVRLKDIIISTKHVNYYDREGSPVTPPESDESDEQSPESNTKIISRIVPVYDSMNNVKITAYTIEDYENGENGEKNEKILKELNIDVNLADLKNPDKKPEIITNIIENLKKDHDIDEDTKKSIEDYLGKLGEAISKLKVNVDVLGEGVDVLEKKVKNEN